MMEAEERPTKLRKLNSTGATGSPGDTDALSLANGAGTAAESLDVSSLQNSKPLERAANDADPPEEGDGSKHDSEDDEMNDHATATTQASGQNGELAQPMSKNQLKKLRKREEWEAGRDYRKAKRKQKTQERKARKRAAKEEEEQRLQLLQEGQAGDSGAAKIPPIPSKPRFSRPVQVPMTIIIDCGFDDLMMEKERISLGSQVTRSYSDNWRAPFQTNLVISSWGGQLKERFDTVLNKHYLNWKGVKFCEGDFVEAARQAEEFMKGPKGGKLKGLFEKATAVDNGQGQGQGQGQGETSNKIESSQVPRSSEPDLPTSNGQTDQPETTTLENANPAQTERLPPPSEPEPKPTTTQSEESSPTGEIIYLTSDSPDTLTTLSPYSTYIIGGLVDKNRHKGICYRRACERGIRTAKLPIGEFMEMTSRKVLATNHVVEIMIRMLEGNGDWGEAFERVIPKRKGGRLRSGGRATGHGGEGKESGSVDTDDDDDDEDDQPDEAGVRVDQSNGDGEI